MKRNIPKISCILILIVAFVLDANCQQQNAEVLNAKDTLSLKEVCVTWDKTIDTTYLKMLFVLEMERVKSPDMKIEPCVNSDFIAFYNDSSAIYFDMGCVWNYQKVFWESKENSIYFYTQENGKKMHIGTPDWGFDFLVEDSSNNYRAINKLNTITNYSFNKKEKISNCNLEYYKEAIR
jgi:hypothetical protein